jgi:tRNA threonylcarbamoyladenosine biosynthesis protein TsaE
VVTHSEEETINFGRRLGQSWQRGVVLLIGNLGSGKTTLAKGIVAGRGAALIDDVSSPTFALIHEYTPLVCHIDLYRLDTEAQVAALGIEELIDRGALVLIEWGERFPRLLPPERIEITFRTLGENERELHIRTVGAKPGATPSPAAPRPATTP